MDFTEYINDLTDGKESIERSDIKDMISDCFVVREDLERFCKRCTDNHSYKEKFKDVLVRACLPTELFNRYCPPPASGENEMEKKTFVIPETREEDIDFPSRLEDFLVDLTHECIKCFRCPSVSINFCRGLKNPDPNLRYCIYGHDHGLDYRPSLKERNPTEHDNVLRICQLRNHKVAKNLKHAKYQVSNDQAQEQNQGKGKGKGQGKSYDLNIPNQDKGWYPKGKGKGKGKWDNFGKGKGQLINFGKGKGDWENYGKGEWWDYGKGDWDNYGKGDWENYGKGDLDYHGKGKLGKGSKSDWGNTSVVLYVPSHSNNTDKRMDPVYTPSMPMHVPIPPQYISGDILSAMNPSIMAQAQAQAAGMSQQSPLFNQIASGKGLPG